MNRQQRRNGPVIYEILVRGVLDDSWSAWLSGMTIIPRAGGETLLRGPVRDQSALHGLLIKIRDMGLPLLSVNRADAEPLVKDNL
jgi:hypothetical protein